MRIVLTTMLLIVPPVLYSQERQKLPDGPGKDTTARLCGSCHAAELVMNRRESFEGWNAVVEDMLRRGMKGSNDELGEVVDYLVAHFPKTAPAAKIRVNKATATELATAFGIAEQQASAIVKHRESQGDFKSFDDLLKVTGIDARAIEAKKSRLEF